MSNDNFDLDDIAPPDGSEDFDLFCVFDDMGIGDDTKLYLLLAFLISKFQGELEAEEIRDRALSILRRIRGDDGRGKLGLSDEFLLRKIGKTWAEQVVLEDRELNEVEIQPIVRDVLNHEIADNGHHEHSVESAVRRLSGKFRQQPKKFRNLVYIEQYPDRVFQELSKFLKSINALGIELDDDVGRKIAPLRRSDER
ncbi:MAG: hypothetical protein ABJH63_08840 [Rhizobiaceae bacterium]